MGSNMGSNMGATWGATLRSQCYLRSAYIKALLLAAQWCLRNAPKNLWQWQIYPTVRGAQSPRNALGQLLKNQGVQWSHVGTVRIIYQGWVVRLSGE